MLKSIISGCCLFLVVVPSFAQRDSVELSVAHPEYDYIYQEMFNFSENSLFGELNFSPEYSPVLNLKLQQPLVIDFNIYDSFNTITLKNSLPVFSPFINSLAITNQAHYKLSDKLTIGGNSFSANSIYNPLPLNPSIKDMSIRGASMFLEYKISDKFRVGGSFSISNQSTPFF